MAEQRCEVPATAQDAENEHVFVLDAVDDDILATGKLRRPGRKSSSRARPTLGYLARRKNRSVMESIKRSAMSILPLLEAT